MIKRNDPCYCGSGRKYKKCCLKKKETIMETKENTFAKDMQAEASGIVEMQRNQAVHLIHLRHSKRSIDAAALHLRNEGVFLDALVDDLNGMPDCECKTATLAIVNSNIEKNEQAIEATQFNGISKMTLNALEQLEDVS